MLTDIVSFLLAPVGGKRGKTGIAVAVALLSIMAAIILLILFSSS
jgi:hypothetical protein